MKTDKMKIIENLAKDIQSIRKFLSEDRGNVIRLYNDFNNMVILDKGEKSKITDILNQILSKKEKELKELANEEN